VTSDTDRSLIGHLLRRTGFGAHGPEIDAAAAAGYQAALDARLASVPDSGAAATPAPLLAETASGKPDPSQTQDLIAWWIARMTAADNPWPEKRTYFWHGHYATSIQKVRYASLMLAQNQTLRSLGGGDFHTLMRTMFTDPAMMLWLDAEGSTAKAPNENLARESMELFSLGAGNYTETDVRQAALALTGWRLDRTSAAATFVARGHAPGPETILGKTASFDVDSFTDLLLAQPACPRFVVARHWFRLGSADPIPAATQQNLLTAYGVQFDLSALARALFTDPVFTGAAATTTGPTGTTTETTARYALVKQPVEYVVGALRALRIAPPTDGAAKDSQLLRSVLSGLGQLPFEPPNVGGWPSGQLWLTTAAAQARIDFARWAVTAGDISAVADASAGSRIDAAAYLLGVDSFSQRTSAALSDVAADPPSLMELALLSPEYQVN
jgi:uncharacterized protein (DUF1800 family)